MKRRAQWMRAIIQTLIVCVIVAAAEAVTGIDLTKGIVIGLLTAHLFDRRQ